MGPTEFSSLNSKLPVCEIFLFSRLFNSRPVNFLTHGRLDIHDIAGLVRELNRKARESNIETRIPISSFSLAPWKCCWFSKGSNSQTSGNVIKLQDNSESALTMFRRARARDFGVTLRSVSSRESFVTHVKSARIDLCPRSLRPTCYEKLFFLFQPLSTKHSRIVQFSEHVSQIWGLSLSVLERISWA